MVGVDVEQIKSIEACLSIAQHLERLARTYRDRANDLKYGRKNVTHYEDKRDLSRAVNQAFRLVISGDDITDTCDTLSYKYQLNRLQVQALVERKLSIYKRDKLKNRNIEIIKLRRNGKSIDVLAQRYGLSKAQISKICRPPHPDDIKAKQAGLSLATYRKYRNLGLLKSEFL